MSYYIEVAGQPLDVVPSTDDCASHDNANVDDNGQSECFNVPPDGKDDCDVPFMPCVNIGGTVYIDNDTDGCVDSSGDTPLPGIDVVLYVCDPSTGSPAAPNSGTVADATQTNEDGYYEFPCIDPSLSYYIEVAGQPLDVVPSTDDCASHDNANVDDNGQSECFNVPPDGKDDCDVPFVPCVNVTGTVFTDLNDNGCVDDSDDVLQGITDSRWWFCYG